MPRRNRRPLGPAEKAARARMDEAAKSVLGHRSVLARILKGFIGEFQNVALAGIERECIIGIPQIQRVPPDRNVPVCIPGMAQEDTALDEGKVVYDILPLAKVPSGKAETWVHINVESQNDFCPGYPLGKRGICRLARMISGQHESVGHHQQYGKPEKVCSIWICTDPPARRRNTVSRFRTIEEILTGNVRSQKKYYDLRSLVMICLGDPNQGRRGMRSGFWMCCLSLRMGMQEKNDILEQEFGMTMEPDFREEVNRMRTWSDEVFDQGMEVAQENCIRSLMENKGWTMEYAMDALNIKDKKIRREMTNRIETAPGGITRGWLNRLPGDTGGRAGRP